MRLKSESRREYLDTLAALYRLANRADTETAKHWQRPEMASTHCCPIEAIVKDMTTPDEYQEWLDNI